MSNSMAQPARERRQTVFVFLEVRFAQHIAVAVHHPQIVLVDARGLKHLISAVMRLHRHIISQSANEIGKKKKKKQGTCLSPADRVFREDVPPPGHPLLAVAVLPQRNEFGEPNALGVFCGSDDKVTDFVHVSIDRKLAVALVRPYTSS
jgi:hypothetical protein